MLKNEAGGRVALSRAARPPVFVPVRFEGISREGSVATVD
jgi:hypothetical protein